MELFQRLGAEIEQAWREQNYNEEGFPALAAEALRGADLPSKVDAWEIIEWTLQEPDLPAQKDPHANFGDPPITLFAGPRFYIDVYFWLEGTTTIHQHAFYGAFQVLLGSSLHSWYDFDRTDSVNAYLEIGEMRLKTCELLKVGDVLEIVAGRRYIHSLYHLDQPSATIVVRTEGSSQHLPQYSYHKPSLAFDPSFDHAATTKRLQCIRALYSVHHPDADRLAERLLETSDFQTSYAVLSTVRHFLGGSPLGQLFNLEHPTERFNSLLEVVARRHGSKAKILEAVFEHSDRTDDINRRRSYVTNAEHRFFFALLLNVEGLDTILRLVSTRFPDADPVGRILDWVHELANTRVVGVNTPNALGIENFDDIDVSILENLLRKKSDAEMFDVLSAEYGTERLNAAGIDGKLHRIRASNIFQPLLVE